MDKSIVEGITRSKYVKENYPQFFQPEIWPFINEKWAYRIFSRKSNQYGRIFLIKMRIEPMTFKNLKNMFQ